ncbi:MAG: hypothetical protein IKJ26_02100 [Clostridia bacterium]|nr:hypothetical protein [Clostridia bacterium]
MNISGQSKAFCLHSVPDPAFEVFQQTIRLFLCDDAFRQEVSSAGGINVPPL